MDDYDPLDAFMEENEAQKEIDDKKFEEKQNKGRSSIKRDTSDSLNAPFVPPRQNLLKGLQTPMKPEANSFGLKMLQKMGYKEGEGLGKDGTGIKEPLQVRMKMDKLGIGIEEEERKKVEEENKKKQLEAIRKEMYYNMKKQQYEEYFHQKESRKSIIKDIRSAQFAIESLDEQNGVINNKLLLGGDEDCDMDTLSHHLGMMIDYLRSRYNYCIYCGCSYDDANEMQMSCPGWDRDAHE